MNSSVFSSFGRVDESVSVVNRPAHSCEQVWVEGLAGHGGSVGGGTGGVCRSRGGGVCRSRGAVVASAGAASAGAAADAVAASHAATAAGGRVRRLGGHHLKSAQDKGHIYITNLHLLRSTYKYYFYITSS